MSDNFIQVVTRGTVATDTTTSSVTLTGVTAHSALVAFCFNGQNSAPSTHTCGDGQNASWTAQGSSQSDATNNVWGQCYVLEDANAGSHTVTFTTNSGNACWIGVVEVGSTAGSSVSGSGGNFQATLTSGANTIFTSANVTVSAASTIVACACDTSSFGTGSSVTVGTSPFTFTSRETNGVGVMGDYLIETAAAASSGAATAAANTNGLNYMILAVAILNTASGGTFVEEDNNTWPVPLRTDNIPTVSVW